MPSPPPSSQPRGLPADRQGIRRSSQAAFAVGYGCLLGLALLKFGNPIILDRLIEKPNDFWQTIFLPWPVRWGQWTLALISVLGVGLCQFRLPKGPGHLWIVVLPPVWFAWQLLATTQTVDARLTAVTVVHFATCLLCFGIGLFALRSRQAMPLVLGSLLPFFLWMAWTAFDQHFGGLDATQKLIQQTPNWREIYPAEYLERIEKKRVFGTLVYPNALAGVILLLLPPLITATWQLTIRLTRPSRILVTGVVLYVGVACLFWSGSKSGWLVAITILLIAAIRQPLPRGLKMVLLTAICAAGLIGFGFKFAPYFRKGARSVGARLNYWTAAARTTLDHPWLGTGPGTFGRSYAKVKAPAAEMAQLTHNDYLEQASDSGVLGLISYAGFWWGSIACLYRKAARPGWWLGFAVWLGLLGWCIQSLSEFGLYIPALAWPAFTLTGWLWVCEIE